MGMAIEIPSPRQPWLLGIYSLLSVVISVVACENLWANNFHLITKTRWKTVISHTHTHPFKNGPLSGTARVSRYQKGKTNLDSTKARDSEWQWHQLGHMQVCTSLQTDNHASTPPLCFLQAGCPSCRPANSVKALKARRQWFHDNGYRHICDYSSILLPVWLN